MSELASLRAQAASLLRRVRLLSELRRTVSLPPDSDLSPSQWVRLETSLAAARSSLLDILEYQMIPLLAQNHGSLARCAAVLGDAELELSRHFSSYDLYLDILSQRRMEELGPLLKGCDVLAADAMRVRPPSAASSSVGHHRAAAANPIVYCDRGLGAAILRVGIPLGPAVSNPLPLIRIPYARLIAGDKRFLTSVIHECGHQALAYLRLVPLLERELASTMQAQGAPSWLARRFAKWASEWGADYWAFCACGPAQAASIRQVLALNPDLVFRVDDNDPHPPTFLRVLAAFSWPRYRWGAGPWDEWESEWRALHPLDDATERQRSFLAAAATKERLDSLARILFETRWPGALMDNRCLPDLFDLDAVSPGKLRRLAASPPPPDLVAARPRVRLAAFWEISRQGHVPADALDHQMTVWLRDLASPAETARPQSLAAERTSHGR